MVRASDMFVRDLSSGTRTLGFIELFAQGAKRLFLCCDWITDPFEGGLASTADARGGME
jgi:hypothetical protein